MTTFEQLLDARRILDGVAHNTAVATSQTLNASVGAEVFLKCENLQRIGAFKFRGAWNSVSHLDPAIRARGVVTHSSGNHGQAIAKVGQLMNIPTTIVMPTTAPVTKRAAAEGYGATIVEHDPATQKREEVSASLVEEHGYQLIPPFNHEHVIAGQGSAAAELHDEIDDLDLLITPCGGGGLLSGSALATKNMRRKCKVIGIEPELGDDATRSFRTGTIQRVENPQTIADGTRTESVGDITFPMIRHYVDDMQTVTEQAIIDAVKFLFLRLKLVVEPSGALGVAALMSGVVSAPGKRIGVILSGGNIDSATMMRVLNEGRN